jgi:hypothetical protein
MATDQQAAKEKAAKEQIAKERDERKKAQAQQGVQGSTPTPTQEENDMAAMGVVVDPKQDDGSGPEQPPVLATRMLGPNPSGAYQTRQQEPARQPAQPKAP